MKTGSFVKWSGEGEKGRFSYVGQLVKLTDDRVTLLTADGEMSFPVGDGSVEPASKPAQFDEFLARREDPTLPTTLASKRVKDGVTVKNVPKKVKKAVARKPRAKRGGVTKMDRARALLVVDGVLTVPSRKAGIELLVKELDMTAAGASTYFATVKRELA